MEEVNLLNRRRGYGRGRRNYNHGNPGYGGGQPGYGAGMVMNGPQGNWATGSSSRNMMPTGGVIAKKMRPNPYMLPRGGFRKPRQDEIIKEIQIFTKVGFQGDVERVDGFHELEQTGGFARHVCIVKPYLHFIRVQAYRVTLPEVGDIEVQFLVHECGKIIVNKQTMP